MTGSEAQPSWKKFVDFQGPSPQEEYEALQEWNRRKSALFNAQQGNIQGTGRLMFGTPRKGKCRDIKVNGRRIK